LHDSTLPHTAAYIAETLLKLKFDVMHVWLTAQLKTFFSENMKKLVQLWAKCVKKQGTVLKNYVIVSFLFILK
jgi:hypothetical protein